MICILACSVALKIVPIDTPCLLLAAPLAPGNENPGKYVPIAALVVAPPSTKASASKTPATTPTKPKSKVLAAPAFVQVTCTLDIKAFFWY